MSAHDHNQGEKTGGQDALYAAGLVILVLLLYLPQFLSGLSAIDSPEKMDITTQWFPGFTYWSDCYRQGLFPLWNTQRYGGMPWLIYSHGGMLYLPNMFFYVLFSFPDAVTLSYLFHALIAATGLFILCRNMGLSPPGSFLVACVFTTSGFYFFLQSQLSNHSTVAYLPVFLLFLRRLHARAGFFNFILLCVTGCLMIYSGDTEGLVSNLAFAFLFIILLLRRESPTGTPRTLFLAAAALGLGLLMYSVMVSVMLELLVHSIRSPNSLFDLEFTGFFQDFIKYPPFMLLPWRYFEELHPVSSFNGGLSPFYLGLLPLIGMVLSLRLIRRDRRIAPLWWTAAIMAGYLVATEIEFIADLARRIPVIGQMATPERSIEQVQLALLMAAGCAFDLVRKEISDRSFRLGALMLTALGVANIILAPLLVAFQTRYVLGGLMICMGLAGLLVRVDIRDRTRLVSWAVAVIIIADVYLLALACVPRTDPGLFRLDPAVEEFLAGQDSGFRFISFEEVGPEQDQPDLQGLVHGNMDFDSPWGHMRLPLHRYFEFLHVIDPGVARDWIEILLGGKAEKKIFYTIDLFNPAFLSENNLHLLDLMAVKYILSRGISFKFSSPFSLLNEGGLVKGDWFAFPREKNSSAALLREGGRRALEVELPYSMEFESHVYPGAQLALELKKPQAEPLPWRVSVRILAAEPGAGRMETILVKNIEASGPSDAEFPFVVSLDEFSDRYTVFVLDLTSEKPGRRALVIDPRIIRNDAPFQRIKPGPVDIFVNTRALPRAFGVHKAMTTTPDRIRDMLGDPERFDPGGIILFEEGGVPEDLIASINEQPHPLPDKEVVKMVKHGSQHVRIRSRLFSEGWVFLSDPAYPGWRAWVDGEERMIWRADYVFRAVHVPKGDHTIDFRYLPVSFRAGLWFSIGSVVTLMIVISAGLKWRKKT